MDAFLSKLTHWARSQPGIRSVVLVGSHARGQARPDSDVDLVLLTPQPRAFLDDKGWVAQFGRVKSLKKEDWGKVTSLRVFYENGLEVEFGFATPDWASLPLDEGTLQVISGGMKILVDKQRLLGHVVWKGEANAASIEQD